MKILYLRNKRPSRDPVYALTRVDQTETRSHLLTCPKVQAFARRLRKPWFRDCVTIASKGNDPKSKVKKATCNWGDIVQPWELEAKEYIKLEMRTDFKAEEFRV